MSNKKLRLSAKGRDCQVRIPGLCNFNNETVVLAHVGGAGMGAKSLDVHGAFCCSSCHDEIDSRTHLSGFSRDELKLMHLQGILRTQKIWTQEGLMII